MFIMIGENKMFISIKYILLLSRNTFYKVLLNYYLYFQNYQQSQGLKEKGKMKKKNLKNNKVIQFESI